MLVFAIILVVIICVCLTLIYLILKKDLFKKHHISKKSQKISASTKTEVKKSATPVISPSDDVEVLELYPGKQNGIVNDINDDSLNLNDLFKTISMEAVHDNESFDFGLRRDDKK